MLRPVGSRGFGVGISGLCLASAVRPGCREDLWGSHVSLPWARTPCQCQGAQCCPQLSRCLPSPFLSPAQSSRCVLGCKHRALCISIKDVLWKGIVLYIPAACFLLNHTPVTRQLSTGWLQSERLRTCGKTQMALKLYLLFDFEDI